MDYVLWQQLTSHNNDYAMLPLLLLILASTIPLGSLCTRTYLEPGSPFSVVMVMGLTLPQPQESRM
eukprot:scaffold4248_cov104-Skeletonema_dohrnii-CCMP3373.AAC.2